MQAANLQSNIWKAAITLIANKRVFAAFLSAYYLTIPDTTAQTVGLIFLAGNLAGFLFEIPSGYISDKFGHKETLVLASILMFVSSSFFLLATDVAFLILGSAFMSIGQAFRSGTFSAFMHETLRGLGKEDQYTEIMGKVRSAGFGVPIAFAVLAPFLISISYQAPFILSLVLDFVGIVAAVTLVKPTVTPEHVDEVNTKNFKQVVQEGYKLGYFKYAVFNSVLIAVLMGISIYRAPYQEFLNIPVIWFGVLFGLGRLGVTIILYFSGRIKKSFKNITSFYRFQIILFTTIILGLVSTTNPWMVGFFFIIMNAFTWGLSGIHNGFVMEVIGSSKFKATLLSIEEQAKTLLAGLSALLIGFWVEETSYQIAFFLIGILLILVLAPQYIYIKRSLRNDHTPKEQ
ncbi:MFS transporter [Candidatus Kaiserbacteria bacterium]|nr:MFS transporter [Candidatus Kaiserbacteria bacterium]